MSDVQARHDDRLDDADAHERAIARLTEVAGAECAANVTRDLDHHLQGHVDVGEMLLVVIAPRDEHHQTLVLGDCEWDALRHGCLAGV